MSPLQVMVVVLFVVACVSSVVVAIMAILSYLKMGDIASASTEAMKLAVVLNTDTRRKVAKLDDAAHKVEEVAEKTTKEVRDKVEEVRQAVSEIPKPSPAWKPGDPEPRRADLGPGARGRVGGLILGPGMVLLAVMTHALAVTADPPPALPLLPEDVVAATVNDDRMVRAAGLMAHRRYDDAADLFLRAADGGCDREVCHARRAECMYYLGDNPGVLTEAEVLEQHAPSSPWPAYLRGLVAKRQGNTAQAREHFHRAALLGHPQAAGQLRVTRG